MSGDERRPSRQSANRRLDVPHPDTLGDSVTRSGAFVQYPEERRLGWVCPKCGTWTGPRYRYGSGAALAAYTKHTLWFCPARTSAT